MVLQSVHTPDTAAPDTICSLGLPPTCSTLLKEGEKNKPNLVPELKLMFVEISGDFLVFFLQGKKKKKRGKEGKFHYWMHSGF